MGFGHRLGEPKASVLTRPRALPFVRSLWREDYPMFLSGGETFFRELTYVCIAHGLRPGRLRDDRAPRAFGQGAILVDGVAYYLEKAQRCRRLARATSDAQAIKGLSALADEYDAKAKAVEASNRRADLLSDGETMPLLDRGGRA